MNPLSLAGGLSGGISAGGGGPSGVSGPVDFMSSVTPTFSSPFAVGAGASASAAPAGGGNGMILAALAVLAFIALRK